MIYEFKTYKGAQMYARLVFRGARYGREGKLTPESPMIEFYTASVSDEEPWLSEIYGIQMNLSFVSRYYLDTFTIDQGHATPVTNGVCLDGSLPQFDLSRDDCAKVAGALLNGLANRMGVL